MESATKRRPQGDNPTCGAFMGRRQAAYRRITICALLCWLGSPIAWLTPAHATTGVALYVRDFAVVAVDGRVNKVGPLISGHRSECKLYVANSKVAEVAGLVDEPDAGYDVPRILHSVLHQPKRPATDLKNLNPTTSQHDVREWVLNDRQFQFEWDEGKAAANIRKHGVPFELASTVFKDPQVLTVADLEHSEIEERWFSIGWASNGKILSIVYLWAELDAATVKVRLISAREATPAEIRFYNESL